jgi:HSP20 family protein
MVRYHVSSIPQLGRFRTEMDRLLSDFLGRSAEPTDVEETSRGFPAVNVWQQEDAVFVEAEAPGVKSEDIEISVVGNGLVLKGRRPDVPPQKAKFHRRERGVGEFNRVLRLPVEVDSDKVQAKLTDGVLLITLPKAEAAKPRRIPVSAQ